MAIITVSKELAGSKNLVAIPRDIYEEFLAWQRKIKSVRTFKPTKAEKKAIMRGRRSFARGEYITLEELKHALARPR